MNKSLQRFVATFPSNVVPILPTDATMQKARHAFRAVEGVSRLSKPTFKGCANGECGLIALILGVCNSLIPE